MDSLKQRVTSSDHLRGNIAAPLTLVEYADFQCLFCLKAYQVIQKLQHKMGNKMRFVYRHFPLTDVHPISELAAEISEFAARAGRFWKMHDLLFENQARLSVPLFFELTQQLQLSIPHLEEVIAQHSYLLKIRSDIHSGISSGVNEIPALFINGERYMGKMEENELIEAIEQLSLVNI